MTMSALETEITDLGIWPASATVALAEHWLTTVQQIVALGTTPVGKKQISSITSLDLDSVNSLLARTRTTLSEGELRALDIPVDNRDFGLGALRPDDA